MPPDDEKATAREWLLRARGNLSRAQQPKPAEAFWEDLCFDAQQAAEKAVKAVLIARGVSFPYVHDIDVLLTTLESAGWSVGDEIRQADDLSRYAVETRYPGVGPRVTESEWREAVALATAVVEWAEQELARG